MMFRHVMQILDLVQLDIEHYKFDHENLVISTLILVLGLTFEVFTLSDLQLHSTYIVDYVLNNLDIEFSHMIINF